MQIRASVFHKCSQDFFPFMQLHQPPELRPGCFSAAWEVKWLAAACKVGLLWAHGSSWRWLRWTQMSTVFLATQSVSVGLQLLHSEKHVWIKVKMTPDTYVVYPTFYSLSLVVGMKTAYHLGSPAGWGAGHCRSWQGCPGYPWGTSFARCPAWGCSAIQRRLPFRRRRSRPSPRLPACQPASWSSWRPAGWAATGWRRRVDPATQTCSALCLDPVILFPPFSEKKEKSFHIFFIDFDICDKFTSGLICLQVMTLDVLTGGPGGPTNPGSPFWPCVPWQETRCGGQNSCQMAFS